ncbi:transcriptional regulator [Actinokineospora iranica]|uniref:Transcriptional regulator n=1 Tax=Actinokineospora iranica TaxID=1271860 RepID=A0A1G6K896_9PSEU|nr:transcriptional regulator [Actinokineospora iranica]
MDWLAALVRKLTEKHEAGRQAPWSVDDAPERFARGQPRAIGGVALVISRIEAKAGQNRSAADALGVVAGLTADGQTEMAEAVRASRPPEPCA